MDNSITTEKHCGYKKKILTTESMLFIAYIVIFVFFSIASKHFFSIKNFLNICLYGSIMGISAVGLTMVLLTGGIDVSVGAVMGLVGVVMASLIQGGTPLVFVILIGLAIGTLCGFLNGIFITKLKITPLIVTLSTMAIFRGLAFVFCGGLSIVITNQGFKWFGREYVLGVPVGVWIMIIIYLLFAYILKNFKFGRRVYATGGNEKASFLSGINIDKTKINVYTITGLLAGLSGFLMAAQTGSGQPQAGNGMEMDVIAASVLGGTSLSGGKGKVVGTFIGVLLMATLNNGMVLINIPSFYQQIVKGCVLLLAVFMDSLRTRRAE